MVIMNIQSSAFILLATTSLYRRSKKSVTHPVNLMTPLFSRHNIFLTWVSL